MTWTAKMFRILVALALVPILTSCSDDGVSPEKSSSYNPEYTIGKGNADWVWHKVEGDEAITAVAYNGERYLASRPTYFFKASVEGRHWKNGPYGPPENYWVMTTIGASFVSVGDGPHAAIDTWTSGSWRRRRYQTRQSQPLYAIANVGGLRLAVGARGEMMTTADGQAWNVIPKFTSADLRDVVGRGDWYVVAGDSGTVCKSKNLSYWVDFNSRFDDNYYGLEWGNGLYVFITDAGSAVVHDVLDEDWRRIEISPGHCLRDITWFNERFVVIGDGGVLATSPDGYNWASFKTGLEADFLSVIATDKLVAVGTNGTILNSTDGINWELRPPGEPGGLYDVNWNGDKFVAVGSSGAIYTSYDAEHWEKSNTDNIYAYLHAVEWTGSGYFSVGSSGSCWHSADGIDWESVDCGTDSDLWSLHWTGNKLLVGGEDGTILSVSNGSWQDLSVIEPGAVFGFAESDSQIVSVTTSGVAYMSADAVTWMPARYVTDRLNDVVWTGTDYIALGNSSVFESRNAVDWHEISLGTGFHLSGIASCGGNTVVSGSGGKVFSSIGGVEWVESDSGMSTSGFFDLSAITCSDRGFVIVGDGVVLTEPGR